MLLTVIASLLFLFRFYLLSTSEGQQINSPEIETETVQFDRRKSLILPVRYALKEAFYEPAPFDEIKTNMTLYLSTLHQKFSAMAGPTVTGVNVWETFLEVTKNMFMVWDEQNKHRFPLP
eukprot:gene38147-51518_t